MLPFFFLSTKDDKLINSVSLCEINMKNSKFLNPYLLGVKWIFIFQIVFFLKCIFACCIITCHLSVVHRDYTLAKSLNYALVVRC